MKTALVAASIATLAFTAAADVVRLGAIADTTLYQDAAGALSNGSGSAMFAGTNGSGQIRRGLVRFDVAAGVPAGATITSVSLRLFQSSANTTAAEIRLHRALESWGEGASAATGNGGGGASAAPGDATWLHRFFPGQTWSVAGGVFDPAARAAQTVAGEGSYEWSSASMTTDVQSWLDQPASAFGWLLAGDEAGRSTAKRFLTREELNADRRPELTIEYTPVPAPAALALLTAAGAYAARRRR